MKPTVNDILQRGYFPKEFPSAFNTFSFGNKYEDIDKQWSLYCTSLEKVLKKKDKESPEKYDKRKKIAKNKIKQENSSSICSCYSIPKGKLSRRFLGIPNPLHYMRQAKEVVSAWDEITNVIRESKFSQSKPVYQYEYHKRALTTSCRNVSQFIKKTLEVSFDKKIELRLDISKFYPSIYTHSIPWALLGKSVAKEKLKLTKEALNEQIKRGEPNSCLFDKADKIDSSLRDCQGKQTVGIPIGSDVSFLIAELIASRIDHCIMSYNEEITGCRYYDDYYLYVNDYSEAESLLKFIQTTLNSFGLEINEEKVKIREFPFELEEKFSADLSRFSFSKNFEHSIKLYFSLIWKYAGDNPRKAGQIYKYALKIFDPRIVDRIKIKESGWTLFENLLLKTIILDPSVLNIACRIFKEYSDYIEKGSKHKIKTAMECIFKDHIPLNQHLEVSWALWTCKIFNIEIEKKRYKEILNMKDSVSSLILLDIIHKYPSLLEDESIAAALKELNDSFTEESLNSCEWLLLYEGVKHGWLSRDNLVKDNFFFSILYNLGVSFYDIDIDADFSDEEYLFSRPELIITDEMKQKAVDRATEICNEIFERRSLEIIEEAEEEFGEESLNQKEVEDELREAYNDSEIEKEIVNKIISVLIRDEDFNEEELIKDFLSRIHHDLFY